jgi:hypothetical protein
MFFVSRSITGQYVVTHPGTKTVIVGDDLEATFERMRTLTDAEPAPAGDNATEPATPPPTPVASARSRLVPWAIVLAVLPFFWLGALHLSLGRLVSELRATTSQSAGEPPALSELRARLERVERQLEERPTTPRPRKGPLARPAAPKEDAPPDDAPAGDSKSGDAKRDASADSKTDGEVEQED